MKLIEGELDRARVQMIGLDVRDRVDAARRRARRRGPAIVGGRRSTVRTARREQRHTRGESTRQPTRPHPSLPRSQTELIPKVSEYHRVCDQLSQKPRRRTRAETKEHNRQALLEAAREHDDRDGYRDTLLDEVAEDAGLTKGAIYSIFGGKAS